MLRTIYRIAVAYLISVAVVYGGVPFSFWKAAGGFTARNSQTGTTTNNFQWDYTTYQKIATLFVANASYTVAKADLQLGAVGAPTANMTCEIWSDSAGTPNVVIGTGSVSVSQTTLTGSEATVTFTGMSASVTNGTTYWIVILASALNGASDYPKLYSATQASTGVKVWDGAAWQTYASGDQGKFTLYSSP